MTTDDKKRQFAEQFDDPWDYTHQMLYGGTMWPTFCNEKGIPAGDEATWPEHLKDVPEAVREEYREYLVGQLADYWDVSKEECLASNTMEAAFEEYAAGIG